MHNKSALGGVENWLLLCASAAALCLANSPLANAYDSILKKELLFMPLKEWICEGLMTLFFLQIATELRDEYKGGILADAKGSRLPMIAALGGMIVPAAIFLLANDPPNYRAFAIPCATDIAFALFAFNLIAPSSWKSARLLLLAIAIFDDLGAIALIALFYSSGLKLLPLPVAACGLAAILLSRRFLKGNQRIICLLAGGAVTWAGLKAAGIQPTLAGVLLGLLMPEDESHVRGYLAKVVPLLVMPLFALTSCNISFSKFSLKAATEPLFWGVALGLLIGKQVGICSFAWLGIKTKLATLPKQLPWLELYIVSILAGIGFTMSLFISELSFTDKRSLTLVKTGLVLGSVASALWAFFYLRLKVLSFGKDARN